MIGSPGDRDPVELLADEFAVRCRRGESPSVSEYAAKHPEHAGRIEELFPAVAMLERFRIEEKVARDAAVQRTVSAAPPERIGDFDIIQEIGRGGMGIVYEAEQRSLGRRVAVKVLPKHSLLLGKHLKRFQREAQTTARLRHTNIVPVFGVGDQDGLHYYVMPLVRGVGLDEIVRELQDDDRFSIAGSAPNSASGDSSRDMSGIVRALTARKFSTTRSAGGESPPGTSGKSDISADTANYWHAVAQIGVQAAEALDYAHGHGTLHRDIKPGNLLVDAEGVVCVADFGLARAMDHTGVSHSGDVVGTLRYMAPEQLAGSADARSDIYALGLTLYELLTLRSAFDDADRSRCLKSGQIGPEPAPPRKVNPAIPRDLETIIQKCLAHEPSKRYQSATAVAADLRRFLEDRPILARRASWVERTWRCGRRNPALAAMSGLAAALLIVVGATALTGFIQTRRAYDGATKALVRVEATSQLALDALDDIYLQLSPDRVWIASGSDPGGEVCPCVGLRPSASSSSGTERIPMPVQASKETAALLKNLLVFYDRLAEQAGNDDRVTLESAIASRRVGDIRQRLGQANEAEGEYTRAVEKLAALSTRPDADGAVRVELARSYNGIGNVRSARFEYDRAYESHRSAFSILETPEQSSELPGDYRYELARTLYFLASISTLGSQSETNSIDGVAEPGLSRQRGNEYRRLAISILEGLTSENPGVPDCRFLLALCHRASESGADSADRPASADGRKRAVQILEELKSQYPSVADYRYELAATYAQTRVGLFPWSRHTAVAPEAEQSLRRALDEAEWLVSHNPTIPHYARTQTLVLAKLGTLCRRERRLAEAEDFFRNALKTQEMVIAEFPDLPSHNRALLEFVRLRLGQIPHERSIQTHDLDEVSASRDLLETCIENLTELTERPELAEDRLTWSSLQVAYETLSHVFAEIGENEKAEQAKRSGHAIATQMPNKRRHHSQP